MLVFCGFGFVFFGMLFLLFLEEMELWDILLKFNCRFFFFFVIFDKIICLGFFFFFWWIKYCIWNFLFFLLVCFNWEGDIINWMLFSGLVIMVLVKLRFKRVVVLVLFLLYVFLVICLINEFDLCFLNVGIKKNKRFVSIIVILVKIKLVCLVWWVLFRYIIMEKEINF